MALNKSILLLAGLLIAVVFVSGCTQTKYVCSDGSTVSDSSLCPKQTLATESLTVYPTGEPCSTNTLSGGITSDWFPKAGDNSQICQYQCVDGQKFKNCKTIPTCTAEKPVLNSDYNCVAGGV
jgi:hypothetical protein